MAAEPRTFRYESMGTRWGVTVWDDVGEAGMAELEKEITKRSRDFDETYSRFKPTSLVWQLTQRRGLVPVPHDLIRMLRLYGQLHDLSGGKLNPLVGYALSDMGYDEHYTLRPKEVIRPVPPLHDTVRIVDDEHVEILGHALVDLGALGKGYFVDRIGDYLKEKGIVRFLVDGSGDIYYHGNGEAIRAGLEHPGDPTKVIGVVEVLEGAMCSSATNRRAWGAYHHTIDPQSLRPTEGIVATWVLAPEAALADGLATCLFLTEPGRYAGLPFEYCLMNDASKVKRSAGFAAELF